jgi:hypothetical protein
MDKGKKIILPNFSSNASRPDDIPSIASRCAGNNTTTCALPPRSGALDLAASPTAQCKGIEFIAWHRLGEPRRGASDSRHSRHHSTRVGCTPTCCNPADSTSRCRWLARILHGSLCFVLNHQSPRSAVARVHGSAVDFGDWRIAWVWDWQAV